MCFHFRGSKPQPDNYEGLKAGKLKNVKNDVGLTVEGLQEWHDEACLAVLNNIDQALADLYKFNNELISLDKTITELDAWVASKAQVSQAGPSAFL